MGAKKVLIVDDEAAFTNLVKLNLEKSGRYEVRVENDPRAAVAAAREFTPDVVLLDVIMPGRDGGQVLNEMRQDAALARVPVMFMTATITQAGVDQRKGTIHGAPFLAKPVEPRWLMHRLDEVIKNHGGPAQ
jgi:DNA-binding response OmpR family regulator